MKIAKHDIIEGAKFSLSTSIRRGDLDLLKTSLDILTADPVHKKWLEWRLPVIAVEESPYMMAEYPEKFDDDRSLYRFAYSLCVVPKSKDHIAISNWYHNDAPKFLALSDKYDEVEDFSVFMDGQSDPPPNDYMAQALDKITKRSKMGGKAGDLAMCSPAYYLLNSREFVKDEIQSLIDQGTAEWYTLNGKRKPRTVKLPWYVFDQHTQAGMFALNVFLKNHSDTLPFKVEHFKQLWFWGESAFIPDRLLKKADDNPKVWENMFYDLHLSDKIGISGMDVGEFQHWWKDEIQNRLSGIVEWCLEKRYE